MERRKPYTYLISTVLIFVLAGLFTANIFIGYFSGLDGLLSGIMAVGFFVCGIQELSNYLRARKEEQQERETK